MSDDDLALLRSLAARPVTTWPDSFEARIASLAGQGYIVRTPDGWIATQLGCSVLADRRSARQPVPTLR